MISLGQSAFELELAQGDAGHPLVEPTSQRDGNGAGPRSRDADPQARYPRPRGFGSTSEVCE